GWLTDVLRSSPEVAATGGAAVRYPAAADPVPVAAPSPRVFPDGRTPASCGDPASAARAACSAALPRRRRQRLRRVIDMDPEGPPRSARAVPAEGLAEGSGLQVSRT